MSGRRRGGLIAAVGSRVAERVSGGGTECSNEDLLYRTSLVYETEAVDGRAQRAKRGREKWHSRDGNINGDNLVLAGWRPRGDRD